MMCGAIPTSQTYSTNSCDGCASRWIGRSGPSTYSTFAPRSQHYHVWSGP